MLQRSQIGKYYKKDEILDAKVGKTFVSPNNKEYSFDYRKEGRKYIMIVIFKGHRMQVKESDFNRFTIDELISVIENELTQHPDWY